MRRLHVLAFVFARAAGSLTNLINQVGFELGQTLRIFRRVGEEFVDAAIVSDIADEVVNDFRDALLAAKLVVQRFGLGHLLVFCRDRRTERAEGEDQRDCNC